MKRYFFIIAAIATLICSCSPNTYTLPDGSILSKEEMKHIRHIEDSVTNAIAVNAIRDKQFVVEADQITFKKGYMAHVSASTNFISVNGDKVVVQVALHPSSVGINGMGGITLEGRPSNYDIKTSSKGVTTLTMNVTGSSVSARIEMRIPAGSDRVTATVTSTFHSGRITLDGSIVPLGKSFIVKGMPI